MLLSLQSTRPQYNRLQTNIQIPWNCEYIKYHVASINTKNILTISKDDVIVFEWDAGIHTIQCDDTYDVDVGYINHLLKYTEHNCFDIRWMNNGQIEFTPLVDEFKFTHISHRVALVTGLYNIKLNEELPKNVPFLSEVPIVDYANKLYLISKQGQAIQSNIGEVEYTPSVIASIDHVIGQGKLLILFNPMMT